MIISERGRLALICLTILMILTSALPASAVETGPVDRKWGLGWANGLTARLWLQGVWEFSLSAGPNDNLVTGERHSLDSGYPPNWEPEETHRYQEDKRESGFVEFQAGRLITRRGPVAAVAYLGLNYNWVDSRYSTQRVYTDRPSDSDIQGVDYDETNWTLTLGLRPSVEILSFLTLETAFWLGYRWTDQDRTEWRELLESGQVWQEVEVSEGERFFYGGWSGMGSLQIILWF